MCPANRTNAELPFIARRQTGIGDRTSVAGVR
jgi:hypothetical protein